MNIIKTVKNLNLPNNEYVVFGSALMDIYKIRESNDIDLFLTKKLYSKLKNSGWLELENHNKVKYLKKDNIEAFDNWDIKDYKPLINELILNAEIINEIPFANFSELLKYKLALGREKDLIDIELINCYLNK